MTYDPLRDPNFLPLLQSIMKEGLATTHTSDVAAHLVDVFDEEAGEFLSTTIPPHPETWDEIVEALGEDMATDLLREAADDEGDDGTGEIDALIANEDVFDNLCDKVLTEYRAEWMDDRFEVLLNYRWPVYLLSTVSEQEVADRLHTMAANIVLTEFSTEEGHWFGITCAGMSVADELAKAYLIAHQVPPMQILTDSDLLQQVEPHWHPLLQFAMEQAAGAFAIQIDDLKNRRKSIIDRATREGDKDHYWYVRRLIETNGGCKSYFKKMF